MNQTNTKQKSAVIRGVGMMTPLGHSAWETMRALLAGKSIADRAAALEHPVGWMDPVMAAGCVSVVQHIGCDPAIVLAERAVREAMIDAGNTDTDAGIILGTSKGAVHALIDAADRPNDADRARAVALGPHGYLSAELASRVNIPVIQHVAAACASSLTALHQARLMLEQHRGPKRIIVATSEAALLPMFVGSYRRLGVLPELTPAAYRARPLDEDRSGFMLVQLGAAVVLERAEPKPGDITLTDTAIAADAHDMIRSSPNLSALRHVADRLLNGKTIDLLHPHATGTVENDDAEMAIYHDAGATIRDAYACKGAIGHALGAAGLASLVIAYLCARTNQRPPMPWITRPICKFPAATAQPLNTHAIFAAGFGGHVAGAVIEREARR